MLDHSCKQNRMDVACACHDKVTVQVIEGAFQAVMAREPQRLQEVAAREQQERQAQLRADAEEHKRAEDKRCASFSPRHQRFGLDLRVYNLQILWQ